MPNTELKVINAVCNNKDIHSIYSEDAEIFGAYGDVFEAIKDHYTEHKEVPSVALLNEKFGDDIEALETNGPTAHYVNELRSEFLNARMNTIMLKAAEAKKSLPANKVLEKLLSSLSGLSKYSGMSKNVNLTDVDLAVEHFEKMKALSATHAGVPGISTGIKAIDSAYVTGLAPGHFIVFLGYTGKGKSMFAVLLAVQAWLQGYHPMIVSLEMTPDEVRERAYAIMSSGIFPINDLSLGRLDVDEFKKWSGDFFKDRPDFTVISNEGVVDATPNFCGAQIDRYKPDILIFDYMQLGSDNEKTSQMTTKMLNMSREFKVLATRKNLPIIAISSVTDEENDKRDKPPGLGQAAWSRGIESDANLIVAVHRNDDNPSFVEIVGRKSRHGELFDCIMEVDFNRGIWNERFDL